MAKRVTQSLPRTVHATFPSFRLLTDFVEALKAQTLIYIGDMDNKLDLSHIISSELSQEGSLDPETASTSTYSF